MSFSQTPNTPLRSIVIDHLRKRAKANTKTLVAFAYCRYTDPLPVRAIIAAIIRQILEDYPSTSGFVKPLYDKHELRNTRPTESELLEVLTAIFRSDLFDQRFLSVDGLDEATSDTQFDILDAISGLPINVLFTSRPLPLLKDCIPNGKFFSILALNADIKRLIEEKVRGTATLATLLAGDEFKKWVVKTIIKKSSGM